MVKIQRFSSQGVVFQLSGRIELEDAAELQRLVGLEASGQTITLDVRDITLVDRDALKLLVRFEAEGIKLENWPAYIREWIDIEKHQT
jgi:hypothetical protein